MLQKVFEKFLLWKRQNIFGLYFVLCITSFFVWHPSYAEEQYTVQTNVVDDLKKSFSFTQNAPKGDQTPFQVLENKIKKLGYTLDSFLPEGTESIKSEDINTVMERIIEGNVDELIENQALIDAYNANSSLSDADKQEKIQNYESLNKILNKGLNEIKSQYADKFKKTIENKIKYLADNKCEAISRSITSCSMANPKTLSEIKETGLIKDSALAKAFSQGALKGLIDPKLLITEDEYNERNNPEEPFDEVTASSSNKLDSPKSEKECAVKSLDAYREKIERISESQYVSFVSEGAASPCRLFRLTYTTEKSPFKRRLKEGTFFDRNGKAISLDQKTFDGILQSWGILNGAKFPKSNKVKSMKNPKGSNNHTSGKR